MLRWDRIPKYSSVHVPNSKDKASPGPCCICGALWTQYPVVDFSGFEYNHPHDVGACPRCANSGRHRILHRMHELGCFDIRNKRMLFISPESGYERTLCSELGKNNTVTVSNLNPLHKPDVGYDITNIPVPDCAFDIVFCIHVLEHIEDDVKAVSELDRVLSSSGTLVVGVPQRLVPGTLCDPGINTPELRLKHYLWSDHLRLYGSDFATSVFGSLGYSIRSFGTETDTEWCCAQRILNNDVVHLCRKR